MIRSTLSLLVLAGLVSAQQKVVSPPEFANVYTGSHNGIPFGGYQTQEQLYQQVDEGLVGGGTRLINGMAFAHSWSVDYGARSFDLELSIGDAATDASTISTTYSLNFKSTPTQVFSGTVNWPVRSRGFTLPGPFDSSIDFTAPWAYTGQDPICWEVYIKNYSGFNAGSSDQYYLLGYTTSTLTRKYWGGTMGVGCYDALQNPLGGRAPVTNGYINNATTATVFHEDLTWAAPNRPVVAKLGLKTDNWNGIPLPLNLSLIGMSPACNLYIAPLADIHVGSTDSNGRAEFSLPYTYSASLGGLNLRTQWFIYDATSTGFTSVSNALNHLVPLDGVTKKFKIARNWGTNFGTTKPADSTGRPAVGGNRSGAVSFNYGLITEWRHL